MLQRQARQPSSSRKPWRCDTSHPSAGQTKAPADPDDDHVLAAALTGAVDLIASGDKRDLLPLGSYKGIPIVTARQAWQRIEGMGA